MGYPGGGRLLVHMEGTAEWTTCPAWVANRVFYGHRPLDSVAKTLLLIAREVPGLGWVAAPK
mgnify:CR=1 FL=1